MFVEAIDQTAFATVFSVKVAGPQSPSTFTRMPVPGKGTGFAIRAHFIVFEDNRFDLFPMFIQLVCGVRLLSFLRQDFKLGNLILATEL